jgi:hypothetical protein
VPGHASLTAYRSRPKLRCSIAAEPTASHRRRNPYMDEDDRHGPGGSNRDSLVIVPNGRLSRFPRRSAKLGSTAPRHNRRYVEPPKIESGNTLDLTEASRRTPAVPPYKQRLI